MKLRIGKFKTSRIALFEECAGDIFASAKIVPLDLKWDWNGVATITAFSPLFDVVQEGEEAPSYSLIVHNNEGVVTVEAKRE